MPENQRCLFTARDEKEAAAGDQRSLEMRPPQATAAGAMSIRLLNLRYCSLGFGG